MSIKIAVIGLGYVGLPLAIGFAKKYPGTVGFDIDAKKVEKLKSGIDVNDEGWDEELKKTNLLMTSRAEDMKGCNFFIVGVPTPVDENHQPDLKPVMKASASVGTVASKGSTIVFESTVYPGVTEDICGPIISQVSGLTQSVDFKLGYSPERINPGDKEHSLEKIVKVVSGEDQTTLDLVAEVYSSVVEAGVHRAPSIKVAEAAKVIENTQRDLNIALMNELSLIFDRMNISTKDVLEAASTKWNFLRFTPGLVGGHCIGVDPYYLTTKAEQLGYHPEVILAGRRINDSMGFYVGQRLIKLMVNAGLQIKGSRVGILGVTFKENVSDIRNSRVPDIMKELKQFGVDAIIHDPYGDAEHVSHEYGINLSPLEEFQNLDAVVLAVSHKAYQKMGIKEISARVKPGGVIVDLKLMFRQSEIPSNLNYWSL